MPITSVSTGLYEGLTLYELKARALAKLKQKAGNYDRYSESIITDALNDGLVEAVRLTKCLRAMAIIEMKEGWTQYKSPSQLLMPDKFYYYKSSTNYWELTQKNRRWLDMHKPGWRTDDGDPYFVYPGETYGNMRKFGFYPKPDADGESYVADPDTGVVISETGAVIAGNVTGMNNAASATVCTDSDGRTLSSLGVTVGLMAVNVTDNSTGQISDVTGTTFTCTLAGGTANTWAIGDSFQILSGEYGVVVNWTDDEQFIFPSEIGGLADVTTITGNVLLEYIKRPLKWQFDTQYPELPPELHPYLADYVPYYLKRNSPRGSGDLDEAMTAYQAFQSNIIGGYINFDNLMEDDCTMECWI